MIPIDIFFNDIKTVKAINRHVKHHKPKDLLRTATGDAGLYISALSAAERYGGTQKTYSDIVKTLAALYVSIHVITVLYGAQKDTFEEIKRIIKQLDTDLPQEVRAHEDLL